MCIRDRGNDTGIDPDLAGTSSICICHEYPTGCEPYEDWSCGAGIDDGGNCAECWILYLSWKAGEENK